MRALFVVLLMACGASSPPPAQAEPTETGAGEEHADEEHAVEEHAAIANEETACSTVDECVLIPGVCGGADAVNRAHEAEVRARNEQIASVASCAAPPPATFHVVCSAGVCTAVEDGAPVGS